jgi:hypothetical protein
LGLTALYISSTAPVLHLSTSLQPRTNKHSQHYPPGLTSSLSCESSGLDERLPGVVDHLGSTALNILDCSLFPRTYLLLYNPKTNTHNITPYNNPWTRPLRYIYSTPSTTNLLQQSPYNTSPRITPHINSLPTTLYGIKVQDGYPCSGKARSRASPGDTGSQHVIPSSHPSQLG